MAGLAVHGLDEQVLERLEALAAKHGNSVEEEVRRIVLRALDETAPGLRRKVEAIRAATASRVGPPASDSARTIREQRDAEG